MEILPLPLHLPLPLILMTSNNREMSIVFIIIGLLIFFYLLYLILSYGLKKPTQTPLRVGHDEIPLSTVSTGVIASSQFKEAWNNTDGSSLIFFIYPLLQDRTSRISTDEYATIFKVGESLSLKLLVAPDAGRGYSLAPAILTISTTCIPSPNNHGCTDNPSTLEQIDLPEIPLQRWTSVVIVRKGRKINIYLNGKLSASHMCTATPINTGTSNLDVGENNKRLGGTLALMSIASYPLEPNDVRILIQKTVDTTGAPYLSSGISLPVPKLSDIEKLFTCPFGNCENIGKPGPLEQWSSPYA